MVTTPVADVLNDVTVCDSYTLPALSANNTYHSAPDGGGSVLTGPITTSQTVYIWAQLGTCTAQSSFVVTVNVTPDVLAVADVSACDSYALPALAVGHYYSAPDGGGTQLDGTSVTTSQTVYVYAQTGTVPNCFDQESFAVTITTSPVADDPADVTDACASYVLGTPAVGHYYSAANGGGVQLDGSTITTSQTVYVYAVSGTCSDENSFDVTINPSPSFTIDSGCRGAQYVLEVIPATGSFDPATAQYAWSATGEGSIDGPNDTRSVVASGQGSYTVTVTTGGDCSHSETVSVDNTGCTIQKGISPNGDGWNDFFDLEGQNVTRLEIFNRYGTVVYKKSNYSTQWHGQSDGGDELPDGTYYYVIERAQGETKTGWIYINREN